MNVDHTKILSNLNTQGYITDTTLLAQGGNAFIYTAKKDNADYVVRITPTNSDEYEKLFEEKKNINNKLYAINNSSPSVNKCIDDTIACSYNIYLHNEQNTAYYIVEIMHKYDMSLFEYMVNFENDMLQDKNSYFVHSLNNPDNILFFHDIAKKLLKSVKVLHDNNIAHGDIKPENILIMCQNNSDKITDVALSDFDTLCIDNNNHNHNHNHNHNQQIGGNFITQRISGLTNLFSKKNTPKSKQVIPKNTVQTNVEEVDEVVDVEKIIQKSCEPNPGTALYSTPEYLVSIKKGVSYDIDIMKRTDNYAMALVILTLWFGFIKFFDTYGIGSYNDGFFNIKILKIYNQDKQVFDQVFSNLSNLMNSSKNELLAKYPDLNDVNNIESVYTILNQCIEVIKNVKKFRYIQATPSSRNMLLSGGKATAKNKTSYQYKYNKYKLKYTNATNNKN
jgi:serine/threonine protein kinase